VPPPVPCLYDCTRRQGGGPLLSFMLTCYKTTMYVKIALTMDVPTTNDKESWRWERTNWRQRYQFNDTSRCLQARPSLCTCGKLSWVRTKPPVVHMKRLTSTCPIKEPASSRNQPKYLSHATVATDIAQLHKCIKLSLCICFLIYLFKWSYFNG